MWLAQLAPSTSPRADSHVIDQVLPAMHLSLDAMKVRRVKTCGNTLHEAVE